MILKKKTWFKRCAHTTVKDAETSNRAHVTCREVQLFSYLDDGPVFNNSYLINEFLCLQDKRNYGLMSTFFYNLLTSNAIFSIFIYHLYLDDIFIHLPIYIYHQIYLSKYQPYVLSFYSDKVLPLTAHLHS